MGGVQFSTFYLIQELQNYPKIEIQLLLPRHGQFSRLCESNLIPFFIYKSQPMLSSSISLFQDSIRIPNPFAWINNLIRILYNSKSIRDIFKHNNNIIILSKGFYSHFVTTIANRKLSHKLIWHLQDLISSRFGGLLLKLLNFLAKVGPNFIICDGKSVFDSLNTHNQSKANVILNGVQTDLFQRTKKLRKYGREEFNIPQDAYVIGHVGRFTPWKGQLELIEAFIDYSNQNKQAILLLVGAPIFDSDFYLNEIKKRISNYELKDKIILTGFRSDLDKMFSTMDLFVYPSLEKDTSPLALLSALSSGIPVAVSSTESLDEIIKKFIGIPIFNPSHKSEIIIAFHQFETERIRDELGQIIFKNFNKHFNMKIHTQYMTDVFYSI